MLRVHKGEGAFPAFLKRSYIRFTRFSFTPKASKPFFHFLYHLYFTILFVFRQLFNMIYFAPMFKARCETVGKNLSMWTLPHVLGPVLITIGDDVNLFGALGVMSGRIFDAPRLVIGNRVGIGHNVQITVNREVVIEEEVNIAGGVRIADTDAHPRDTEARIKGLPPPPNEIKPVRICRGAWLGGGCWIMKGVTIGEGAVIGVNSVVLTEIPPFAVAMGNPARIVVRDIRTTPQPPEAPQPNRPI